MGLSQGHFARREPAFLDSSAVKPHTFCVPPPRSLLPLTPPFTIHHPFSLCCQTPVFCSLSMLGVLPPSNPQLKFIPLFSAPPPSLRHQTPPQSRQQGSPRRDGCADLLRPRQHLQHSGCEHQSAVRPYSGCQARVHVAVALFPDIVCDSLIPRPDALSAHVHM